MLATSTSHTLYLNTTDSQEPVSVHRRCAATWPPLKTKGKPVPAPALKKSLLATAKYGAKLQVTYNGHPLYQYIGDKAAGQANGEALHGQWYVLTAAGQAGASAWLH